MPSAIVIPLKNWQDPQGDVILIYSEAECTAYFACWNADCTPANYIGFLSFEGAATVRSFAREFIPYVVPTHPHHSYILRISDSDLVRDRVAYRSRVYPGQPGQEHFHFVVQGHDIYHEVLATGFSEGTILLNELREARLLALHGNA